MTLPALLTKVDRRSTSQDITNEAHDIGEDTANFVFLVEIPREDGESTVSIPGYSEVSGAPDPSEFLVYYSGRLAGTIEFHGDDDADSIQVTYKGLGSSLFARDLNNVHEWLEEHIAPDTGIITAAIFDGPIGTGAATPAAVKGTSGDFSERVRIGTTSGVSAYHALSQVGVVTWNILNTATTGVFSISESGVNAWFTIAMTTGAVSTLGTLTSGGDFTVGASKLVVTASTGALQMDGNLIVSGTGPHATGGATIDWIQNYFQGNYSSEGAGTAAIGTIFDTHLTGHSGDSSYLCQLAASGTITLTGNTADVATVRLVEPQITLGGHTATNASTLLITGVPDEGSSGNWAIRSLAGAWYNAGTFQNVGAITGDSTLEWGGGASIASSDDVALLAGAAFTGAVSTTGTLTTDGGLQTFGDNDSGGSGFRQVLVPNV